MSEDRENAILAAYRGQQANPKVRQVIAECQRELAINFDAPAIRIIEFHATRIGLTRNEMSRLIQQTPADKLQAEREGQ